MSVARLEHILVEIHIDIVEPNYTTVSHNAWFLSGDVRFEYFHEFVLCAEPSKFAHNLPSTEIHAYSLQT